MALIRSAFWLTVAFAVIGPQVGANESIDDVARNAAAGGTETGRQFVSAQLDRVQCQTVECHSGKAIVGAGLGMFPTSQAGQDASASPTPAEPADVIPVPAPRPAWMG